jgi:hypothetical protein
MGNGVLDSDEELEMHTEQVRDYNEIMEDEEGTEFMSIVASEFVCPFEYSNNEEEELNALSFDLWKVYYPYKFAGDS